MTRLILGVDARLDRALGRIAKSTRRSKGEVARDMIKRQMAVLRFRELRAKTVAFARKRGLLSDKDVLNALS